MVDIVNGKESRALEEFVQAFLLDPVADSSDESFGVVHAQSRERGRKKGEEQEIQEEEEEEHKNKSKKKEKEEQKEEEVQKKSSLTCKSKFQLPLFHLRNFHSSPSFTHSFPHTLSLNAKLVYYTCDKVPVAEQEALGA